ncbi:MAG: hypothetical protein WA902_16200 [Thermosynechococcaceae cyanobacterium]
MAAAIAAAVPVGKFDFLLSATGQWLRAIASGLRHRRPFLIFKRYAEPR